MNGDVAWMPGTRRPVTAVGDVAEGKMAVFADATGRKVRAQDVPTPQPVSHFVEARFYPGPQGAGYYVDCSSWQNGERYMIGAGSGGGYSSNLMFVFSGLPNGVFSFGVFILVDHGTVSFLVDDGESPSIISQVTHTGKFFDGMILKSSGSSDGVVKAFA